MKNVNSLKTLYFIVLCAILPAGCATALNHGGEQVRVTNNYEEIMGCKSLGRINSFSELGNYGFEKSGINSAMNELRNRAARSGANIVVIQKVLNNGNSVEIIADAFWCGDR